MTKGDIWLIVYLAIILAVLGVLWVVQLLATSGPVKDFEAQLERDKDKARSHLWRTTL